MYRCVTCLDVKLSKKDLTDDAKAVLIVGLLEGKRPADGSSQSRKRLKWWTDAGRDAADSDVRSTVIGHHVRVKVIVGELNRRWRIPNIHSAVHLPVHSLRFTWTFTQYSHSNIVQGSRVYLQFDRRSYLQRRNLCRCHSNQVYNDSSIRWNNLCSLRILNTSVCRWSTSHDCMQTLRQKNNNKVSFDTRYRRDDY